MAYFLKTCHFLHTLLPSPPWDQSLRRVHPKRLKATPTSPAQGRALYLPCSRVTSSSMVHRRLRCAGGRERMRASICSVKGVSHWMRVSRRRLRSAARMASLVSRWARSRSARRWSMYSFICQVPPPFTGVK